MRQVEGKDSILRESGGEGHERASNYKMSCRKNSIVPQIEGKESRQHKEVCYFHKVTIFSLDNSILLGSVSTGALENNPFRGQKLIKGMVLKLTTIVTPQNNNFHIELLFYGVIKVPKYGSDLRFVRDEKDPGKTGMVINVGHKLPFPKSGCNLRRSQNITMDKSETTFLKNLNKQSHIT